MTAASTAPHRVKIVHDPESHAAFEGCHDGCTATVVCPGVTDACRTWWECGACQRARAAMTSEELDEHDDLLDQEGAAHGVEHRLIDGMWMVPSNECLGDTLESDAGDLVYTLPAGEHPVDLACEEGYVYVIPITSKHPAPVRCGPCR